MVDVKTVGRSVLRTIGVEGHAMRARDRRRARRALRTADASLGPDGLPVPPRELINQVAGEIPLELFHSGGSAGRAVITEILARNGADIREMDAILDFGVGCGRVARHWHDLPGSVHGCDYNPILVQWTQDNLPFVSATRNRLEPPLPYESEQFDLIYALSVFTHLTEVQQIAWITELRRVTKPGGYVLFTTHGPKMPHQDESFRSPEIQAKLAAGELLVFSPDHAGRNNCAALHPRSWVEARMLDGFGLVEYAECGATMNGGQDIYLVQRAQRQAP